MSRSDETYKLEIHQLIQRAEAQPCACGKRQTSEPQLYVPGSYRTFSNPGMIPKTREVLSGCRAVCGVCREEHTISDVVVYHDDGRRI